MAEQHISHFPHENPFRHQWLFYQNRLKDLVLKSPTCSGKTEAFLFAFINEYLERERAIKCLYLAPTRLLLYSQLENIRDHLAAQKIPFTILEGHYRFSRLFKDLFAHDFIISSPDIIYYILLRSKHAQHINPLYKRFIDCLFCVVFDELHLYDTFILLNIQYLIKIMKNIQPNVRIYLLSATFDLNDIFDLNSFQIITGESKTAEVQVKADELNYFRVKNVIEYIESNDYVEDTIYVCNSVDRALELHRHFEGSALLIGKQWYYGDSHAKERQILANYHKCKEGALTFATSVFRQGIDLHVGRLITEEPTCLQDAIQTFGRCGRRDRSEFILLSRRSPVLNALNADKVCTRSEFELLLANYYLPKEWDKLREMMSAIWYKLYLKTKLKQYVEFLITPHLKHLYEEYREFLPDASFRLPRPSVKYHDMSLDFFELIWYDGILNYLYPCQDLFYVAELKDNDRYIQRKYSRVSKRRLPEFHLIKAKRYQKTPYYNLTLRINDIKLVVNAEVGPLDKFDYIYINENTIVPSRKSFKPTIFFN